MVLNDKSLIVGEATNGKNAIKVLSRQEVDLILMDIRMRIMDGVEATKIIKERNTEVKELILTTFNEHEYIFEGLKNGAAGYLLKDISSEELVKVIQTVYENLESLILQSNKSTFPILHFLKLLLLKSLLFQWLCILFLTLSFTLQ